MASKGCLACSSDVTFDLVAAVPCAPLSQETLGSTEEKMKVLVSGSLRAITSFVLNGGRCIKLQLKP